ncbi:unannotated protein [freshwater metagenome]|uniref:Unannotated protein n=1 Tax=freshwater metagenome TaxID=449393 RepID=A0A6J7EYW3_9ZZZZ|nr:tryptophan-rich sensory protein [Actinomycetota bacterium]
MAPWRIASAIVGILLVLVYAFGANYWNRPDGWYQSLQKPSWQPPGFIFGIIWPYNFIVLGFALYIIASRANPLIVGASLAFAAISIASALRWSYVFYSKHDLHAAEISLLTTAIMTLPVLALAFTQSLKIGIALIPYQLWLFTAAAIAHNYVSNN